MSELPTASSVFRWFHDRSLQSLQNFVCSIYPLAQHYYYEEEVFFRTGIFAGKVPLIIVTGLTLEFRDGIEICIHPEGLFSYPDDRPSSTDDRPSSTDDRPSSTDDRPSSTDDRPISQDQEVLSYIFYILMRDEMSAGRLTKIVEEGEHLALTQKRYSNVALSHTAQELAVRVRHRKLWDS